MPAKIQFSDLASFQYVGDESVRLPLSQLTADGHIHGRLQIEIDGRLLPALGYWGPDDVCLNTWLEELIRIDSVLSSGSQANYVFDEGEQGQPAYEFRRESEMLCVSVKDSESSGGRADPSYQDIACLWAEFKAEIDAFLRNFRSHVEAQGGAAGRRWWQQNTKTHNSRVS